MSRGKITKRSRQIWSWFTKHRQKYKHEKTWPHFHKNGRENTHFWQESGRITEWISSPFFDYPNDIRKAIYITNAVESLNSVIHRVIKKRKVFPADDSVFKVIWLVMKDASKKWTILIQNWKQAMNRFMIDFGDRLKDHR